MKVKTPILVALTACVLLAGCSSGTGGATPAEANAAQSPQRSDLSAKLKSMSPEERAAYVQQHPEEVRSTYSQVPGSAPSGGN